MADPASLAFKAALRPPEEAERGEDLCSTSGALSGSTGPLPDRAGSFGAPEHAAARRRRRESRRAIGAQPTRVALDERRFSRARRGLAVHSTG
jgi:hypothetical protein